jgi:hypothetical protein
MNLRSAAVNVVWAAASAPAWSRYRSALRAPAAAQQRVLMSCLRRNADTVFGREHAFDSIRSVADYQSRVPPVSYDDIAPLVHRAARGEAHVLTRAPLERLVPSSGSTAAAKLIPFTADLRGEFTTAIDAWLADLFLSRPALMSGSAYWSISPLASTACTLEGSAVPIGFDSDSRYLGGARQALARSVLAVPDEIAQLQDVEAFRYVTALFLVRARDLRLISVWHPSFLEGLLDCVETHRDRLIHDVDRGSISLPAASVAPGVRARLASLLAPAPARAAQLRRAGRHALEIWPHLSLISCWSDGPARPPAASLARRCSGIAIQPKGLLATEAVVTIPFDGRHPLAIRSHFFEFVETGGRLTLAHEVRRGAEYTLLLTTGGGLYRYRLRDRVVVDDFVHDTPSLRFLGRDDRVSDLFGEKLSDGFAGCVLEQLFPGAPPQFALLAPDRTLDGVAYTLFVAGDGVVAPDLAARLERALRLNPQYAWCVDLGQLRPARVARVGPGAMSAFIGASVAGGQGLGDVKPVSLSSATGWRDRLPQPEVEAAC